jgi:hypothetical protein
MYFFYRAALSGQNTASLVRVLILAVFVNLLEIAALQD